MRVQAGGAAANAVDAGNMWGNPLFMSRIAAAWRQDQPRTSLKGRDIQWRLP
jgi:hypothetical protein